MTASAGEGFGSHPFGEIAKATVAAQERSLELAQAWSESLRGLVAEQAEGGLVQGWNDAFLRLLEAAPGAQPRRPARGD